MTPCINLYPTTACDAKNDNRKQNTIASYAMKKFGIEYQGFLLRFCTHRNYFNCVFRSTKLSKYAIRSLIWSYDYILFHLLDNSIFNVDVGKERLVIIDYLTSLDKQSGLGTLEKTKKKQISTKVKRDFSNSLHAR